MRVLEALPYRLVLMLRILLVRLDLLSRQFSGPENAPRRERHRYFAQQLIQFSIRLWFIPNLEWNGKQKCSDNNLNNDQRRHRSYHSDMLLALRSTRNNIHCHSRPEHTSKKGSCWYWRLPFIYRISCISTFSRAGDMGGRWWRSRYAWGRLVSS